MTKLLILASGGGVRNSMFTYDNALPKALMSVGNKTCLEAIIDSYEGLVDGIYVAVQDVHAASVQALLDFKHIDCHIISFPAQSSAMASLKMAVTQIATITGGDGAENDIDESEVTAHDWYLNWSDVFVDKMPKAKSNNVIFVDKNYVHRNIAINPVGNAFSEVISTRDQKGNVPGIFYVCGQALAATRTDHDSLDFDKFMTDFEFDCELQDLPEVHDIGDYAKYNAYMQSIKTDNVCRYFNELVVEKSKVMKRPRTKVGEQLHEIELAYYRKYGAKAPCFAKLLGYDQVTKTMTLERIKGQTCQAFADARPESSKLSGVNTLIKKFTTAVEMLHDIELNDVQDSNDDLIAAVWSEFYDAIDKRVLPCMPMIEAVLAKHPEIKTVEGMRFVSYDKLKSAVHNWVEQKLASDWFKFGVTHGDPNTDNSMISKDGIRFVDPRGYFGKLKTLGYGVTQYDLAKFIYGFSGYSKVNSAEYIAMNVEDDDLKFYVGPKELTGLTDVSLFDMNVSNDIKVLVGIIWVKLTSYIINDPMKSVAAYLYGNALLTKLLNIR